MMDLVSSFQERLREAMNGTTVTDFAAALDISKQSVSAYINGTRKPKRLTISAMAQVLKVSPAWLMGYDVDRYVVQKDDSLASGVRECLSEAEQYLLNGFRDLSEQGQDYIIQTLNMALNTYKKAADTSGKRVDNVG